MLPALPGPRSLSRRRHTEQPRARSGGLGQSGRRGPMRRARSRSRSQRGRRSFGPGRGRGRRLGACRGGGRMSIEIPEGLTELLQGFTVEVLRHQPADLLDFALQHFTRLQQENERKGTARFSHEGRTWGDTGVSAGSGTPSKVVNCT
ncbi:hypothetical protein P7K49_013149 [Saguinus oedipus]|uniref:RIIa domain-containing protein n=1 Tax=Saguinus oedipus TaxID=9490 RepID=A0ABQ9VF34_SAGOE|nr:hypothetical protein P7K49_013149 [Saguinus oedipus]